MITESEIKELHAAAESIVNAECERDFSLWREQCLKSFHVLAQVPDGLESQLEMFIQDKKHLFFRGYRERIIQRVKDSFKVRPDYLTKNSVIEFKTASISLPIGVTPQKSFNFNEHRDRLFLETYLQCKENARQTAEKLGIANSFLKMHRGLSSI